MCRQTSKLGNTYTTIIVLLEYECPTKVYSIVALNINNNQQLRVKHQQQTRKFTMFYRSSLVLKLILTAMASLLQGVVQCTQYPNVTTRVGNAETLGPCTIDKNIPNARVMWEVYIDGKKTKTILKTRSTGSDRIRLVENEYGESNLEIRTIRVTDAGRYICKTGASDNWTTIVEIELIVKFAPELYWTSGNQTVNEGETHEMWCNSTGIPKPNIEWFRKSRVNNGAPAERIGINGNMLRIHNVTRFAGDIYICNASNELGSVMATTILDVSFPAQLEVLEKEIQRSKTEIGVELVCAVIANPMVNISWYKGEERESVLQKPYKYKVTINDDMKEGYYTRFSIMKIISTLDGADFDMYYCEAHDDSGHSVTEKIKLTEKDGI